MVLVNNTIYERTPQKAFIYYYASKDIILHYYVIQSATKESYGIFTVIFVHWLVNYLCIFDHSQVFGSFTHTFFEDSALHTVTRFLCTLGLHTLVRLKLIKCILILH